MKEKRYKGYYIDFRLIRFNNGISSKTKFGFARVGVNYTYRHSGNQTPLPNGNFIYDKQEKNVRFLSWIENYRMMIKTKKYELPIKYDDLQINEKRAVRLQYMQKQGMLCKHCDMYLTEIPAYSVEATIIDWDLFPKNFKKFPIHLHHDHKTGMTIGAVHMKCNAYLWQYKKE